MSADRNITRREALQRLGRIGLAAAGSGLLVASGVSPVAASGESRTAPGRTSSRGIDAVGHLEFGPFEAMTAKVAERAESKSPDLLLKASGCSLLAEKEVGPTLFRNIPEQVPGLRKLADPHGVPAFGEFVRERAWQYNTETNIPTVIVEDFSKPWDVKPNTWYVLGKPGTPGWTPAFNYQLPGKAWEYATGAEAGLEAHFAVECLADGTTGRTQIVENSIWSHRQWDKIEENGGQAGNQIGIKRLTRTIEDPGRVWKKVRNGHFKLIWWQAEDNRFAFDQLKGFIELDEANFASFIEAYDTSNGALWTGITHMGEYPGKRRQGLPNQGLIERLWDNFSGLPEVKPRITPINPIDLESMAA